MADDKKDVGKPGDIGLNSGTVNPKDPAKAREDNKKELQVKTDWVILEFTDSWGSKKKGDKEKYHISTAKTLVKRKVAKVIEELTKYVPAKVVE